jgi:hypothetical protein
MRDGFYDFFAGRINVRIDMALNKKSMSSNPFRKL